MIPCGTRNISIDVLYANTPADCWSGPAPEVPASASRVTTISVTWFTATNSTVHRPSLAVLPRPVSRSPNRGR